MLAVVPDWVYPPSVVIPEIPVKTPVVEISQSLVLIEPRSPPSPRVKELVAVKAPLAVNPEVAVISPEMVGVAVQVVPVTVRFPPRVVSQVPTVKVLVPVTEVAPFKETLPVPVLNVLDPV